MWFLVGSFVCVFLIYGLQRSLGQKKHFVARFIDWAYVFISESFLFVVSLLLRPFSYFEKYQSYHSLQGRPVLLIHGYLHNSSAWLFMKYLLMQRGLGPLYGLNLKKPFGSIQGHADQVKQKIAQIREETGRKDVVLVGHSMGGLVIAWYAVQNGNAQNPIDVITLGSPLRGTLAANIALGKNGKEMRIDSLFIQELRNSLSNNPFVSLYCIGTQTDQLIIPYTSALYSSVAKETYEVKHVGHLGLLCSPKVADQLFRWIN